MLWSMSVGTIPKFYIHLFSDLGISEKDDHIMTNRRKQTCFFSLQGFLDRSSLGITRTRVASSEFPQSSRGAVHADLDRHPLTET